MVPIQKPPSPHSPRPGASASGGDRPSPASPRTTDAHSHSDDEHHSLFLENAPVAIVVHADHRVVFANRHARELFGATPQIPLEGCSITTLVHPDHLTDALERVQKVYQKGKGDTFIREQFVRLDGTVFDVEVNTSHILFKGEPAAQVAFTDITSRLRAEEERDRMFALSIDMLCVAGFDGHFKQLNPAWKNTLGWETEEMLTRPWLWFVHPDDADATIHTGEGLARGEPALMFENRYRCKDGSWRWLSWNSFPLANKGLIFAVVRDVTELHQIQERLRHSEKMEAIGQLAGGIAHDFNNQLSGIMGYADLLREALHDNHTLSHYADTIVKAARHSSALTRQLLAFARKGRYHVQPVAVNAAIQEVVALLGHSIERDIVIEHTLQACPDIIEGDASQVHNALLNIGLNARDAMPGGGTLHFASATTVLSGKEHFAGNPQLSAGRYVRIGIRDTGQGIDPSIRDRVFDPFFTTKGVGRGTGMGLAAVYGIAKSHKGGICFDSVAGKGTTFYLYFPVLETIGAEHPDKETFHCQRHKEQP